MVRENDFLPNRLNFDAVIFCGCTFKEMQIIAIISLVTCILLLATITEVLFGMLLIGVGLAFPACVGMVWILAIIFQKAKQGKPKGYVKQKFYLWLEDKGILTSPYVRSSGKWSVGRYLDE